MVKEKKRHNKVISDIEISNYKSFEKKELVKEKYSMNENIKSKKFKVVDARSKDRFLGKVPEPKERIKKKWKNRKLLLPSHFNDCINDDKTFKE